MVHNNEFDAPSFRRPKLATFLFFLVDWVMGAVYSAFFLVPSSSTACCSVVEENFHMERILEFMAGRRRKEFSNGCYIKFY
jgi:hypothetical protein